MPALYNKHRPTTFDEVIGNEASIKVLQKNLSKTNQPHVYLFSGPPGTGKTTLARIMANELGADEMDIKEINSGNSRGIETAREIIQQIRYNPIGKASIYILDEAHKWTNDFQNAMLKPFEDTPEYVYFFICTTEPSKIIKAVRSRSTEVKFSSLSHKELLLLLKRVCKLEGFKIDKEVLSDIADNCEGSARNALVLLDSVSNAENESEIKDIIKAGAVDEDDVEIIELARALINTKNTWKDIAKILKKLQENGKMDNPESIRYVVLGYMNAIIINGNLMSRAVAGLEAFSEPTYNTGKSGITLACLETIS